MSLSIILHISNIPTVATDMVVNTLQPSIRKLYMVITVSVPGPIIFLLLAKVQVFFIIIHIVLIVVGTVLIVLMATMATPKVSSRDYGSKTEEDKESQGLIKSQHHIKSLQNIQHEVHSLKNGQRQ